MLISLTMKTWKRLIERRLRDEVKVLEQTLLFYAKKKCKNIQFALRMQLEKIQRSIEKAALCVYGLEKGLCRCAKRGVALIKKSWGEVCECVTRQV